MEKQKKTLGILGGMGSLATADLFTKIVTLTDAGNDNEHIHIYIDNNSQIADRTDAILHNGKSPLPQLIQSAAKLEKMGADCIIMPCNTAHYFLPQIQQSVNVPILSMIEQTVKVAKQRYPGKKAAVLATEGTIDAGVYTDELKKQGVETVIPNQRQKKYLMDIIYGHIKAGIMPNDKSEFVGLLNEMKSSGADYFILGCTELPVAVKFFGINDNFVEATEEIAKAAIEYCGYKIKKI